MTEFDKGVKIGGAAFGRGAVCTPCLDPSLMEVLAGCKKIIDLLDGWHRGWTEANLAAPVEF